MPLNQWLGTLPFLLPCLFIHSWTQETAISTSVRKYIPYFWRNMEINLYQRPVQSHHNKKRHVGLFYVQFVIDPIRLVCIRSSLIDLVLGGLFCMLLWAWVLVASLIERSMHYSFGCVASVIGFGGHCLGPCLDLFQLFEPRLSHKRILLFLLVA